MKGSQPSHLKGIPDSVLNQIAAFDSVNETSVGTRTVDEISQLAALKGIMSYNTVQGYLNANIHLWAIEIVAATCAVGRSCSLFIAGHGKEVAIDDDNIR